jgi:asparagine synthetase B (glutamine-hydrolysing)
VEAVAGLAFLMSLTLGTLGTFESEQAKKIAEILNMQLQKAIEKRHAAEQAEQVKVTEKIQQEQKQAQQEVVVQKAQEASQKTQLQVLQLQRQVGVSEEERQKSTEEVIYSYYSDLKNSDFKKEVENE